MIETREIPVIAGNDATSSVRDGSTRRRIGYERSSPRTEPPHAAAIDDLLARIPDLALKADLEREIKSLRADRDFGLVFERHLPENVLLPGHPIRRGLAVVEWDNKDSIRWVVVGVNSGIATISRRTVDGAVVEQTSPVKDLFVAR